MLQKVRDKQERMLSSKAFIINTFIGSLFVYKMIAMMMLNETQ